jgi:hypothetical protein
MAATGVETQAAETVPATPEVAITVAALEILRALYGHRRWTTGQTAAQAIPVQGIPEAEMQATPQVPEGPLPKAAARVETQAAPQVPEGYLETVLAVPVQETLAAALRAVLRVPGERRAAKEAAP